MAALEVIVGVVGVLGGAAITAVGAALVQRSTRRSNEQRASLDRQAQAKVQALETAAATRTASRSCALFLGHVIQDLEADRAIDISVFDSTLRALLAELNAAFFRMAASEVQLVDIQPLASVRTSLTEGSTLIRKMLLQKEAGQPLDKTPAELAELVEGAAADLNRLMYSQIVHIRGSDIPEVFGRGYGYPAQPMPQATAQVQTTPRVYPAPAPLAHSSPDPFWFAVPEQRVMVVDHGVPAILEPGIWYLALAQRGDMLEVQTQDGQRGTLRDASGIERA
ncbi:hypothetical protein GCM10017562_75180 [Streptomyces roseofulvus]|uniref:hypothetical protein n=1 Tax=Streptomyces roseofulvus TaxID=33902 RepID=UPI0031FC6FB1